MILVKLVKLIIKLYLTQDVLWQRSRNLYLYFNNPQPYSQSQIPLQNIPWKSVQEHYKWSAGEQQSQIYLQSVSESKKLDWERLHLTSCAAHYWERSKVCWGSS